MNLFKFKQFTVSHNYGMKVGTDAVLLGAWIPINRNAKILDIGTGTGVISLMLVQRGIQSIVGIDIDLQSVNEAKYNVEQSPWKDNITILLGNFCEENLVNSLGKFDAIVSNPPFFIHSIKSDFENRNIARHSESLPFEILISNSKKILSVNGKLFIILPVNESNIFIKLAEKQNLFPETICEIYPYPNSIANRNIITFQQMKTLTKHEKLYIRNSDRTYSDEYKLLTKDFYLDLDQSQQL